MAKIQRAVDGDGLVELGRRWAAVFAVGVCFALLAVGFIYAFDVFLAVFAGVLVAVMLRGLGDWLSDHSPLSRGWATAVVTIAFAAGIVGGMWALAPSLTEQVAQLEEVVPQSIERLREQAMQYKWGRRALDELPSPTEYLSSRRNLLGNVTNVVGVTLGALGLGVVILFIGLYGAIQSETYVSGLVRLFPLSKRPRAHEVIGRIGTVLQAWLIGKFIEMVIVGVLTWIGLWFLGVEIAGALAVLAGLLTFIPNFGPIIAAVPAVLVALMQGPMTAVWVVALYVGIQSLESYLVTPLVQQRAVSLPPVVTIVAQLLLGGFAGVLGLALATPLTAVGLVLVQEVYVRDLLGDDDVGEDAGEE